MTKSKVTELNIYMGIDTLQLTSAIPILRYILTIA